jgi:hypothetical protein
MATLDQKKEIASSSRERDCDALRSLSTDFQTLIAAHCPLCNGSGPSCVVEILQLAIARKAETEPYPGANGTTTH